jgi:hypothetical protein
MSSFDKTQQHRISTLCHMPGGQTARGKKINLTQISGFIKVVQSNYVIYFSVASRMGYALMSFVFSMLSAWRKKRSIDWNKTLVFSINIHILPVIKKLHLCLNADLCK